MDVRDADITLQKVTGSGKRVFPTTTQAATGDSGMMPVPTVIITRLE